MLPVASPAPASAVARSKSPVPFSPLLAVFRGSVFEEAVFSGWVVSVVDLADAAALLALFLYSLRLIFFLIGLGVAVFPFVTSGAKGLGRLAVENGECATDPLVDIGVVTDVTDVAEVGLVKAVGGGMDTRSSGDLASLGLITGKLPLVRGGLEVTTLAGAGGASGIGASTSAAEAGEDRGQCLCAVEGDPRELLVVVGESRSMALDGRCGRRSLRL